MNKIKEYPLTPNDCYKTVYIDSLKYLVAYKTILEKQLEADKKELDWFEENDKEFYSYYLGYFEGKKKEFDDLNELIERYYSKC